MVKETTLSKKFIKWLLSLPKTKAVKRYAGPGRKGWPDISGCSHGFRIEVEVKVGDNKPTKLQNYWLKYWKSAGAVSYWSNNLEDLKEKFRKEMAQRGITIGS